MPTPTGRDGLESTRRTSLLVSLGQVSKARQSTKVCLIVYSSLTVASEHLDRSRLNECMHAVVRTLWFRELCVLHVDMPL